MSRIRASEWLIPPPPRKRARRPRFEQRVHACTQAMRDLYRIHGLGEPTVESFLHAANSRSCRDDLSDVWPECARRAARDVGRETGLFWPEVYLAACRRVGVRALDGRRPRTS